MEEDRSCSAKWPRYALYGYSTISVLIGATLIGMGVYFFKNDAGYKDMFSKELRAVSPEDIDVTMFICITTIVIGCCMIISSLSLAVCGAFKMNKSCIAAYMIFAIFGFLLAGAVGITLIAHEPRVSKSMAAPSLYREEIIKTSLKSTEDRAKLDIFMRTMMIISLAVSAFQMVGVTLSCCLQKAIEDINKL